MRKHKIMACPTPTNPPLIDEELLRTKQQETGWGPGRLQRHFFPDVPLKDLRTAYDRLKLRCPTYHVWTGEEEEMLTAFFRELGPGANKYTELFPHIPVRAISSKMRAMGFVDAEASARTRDRTRLTSDQHRKLRAFIREHALTLRPGGIARKWNAEIAGRDGVPEVKMDLVRFWLRRKPSKAARPDAGANYAREDRKRFDKLSQEQREAGDAKALEERNALEKLAKKMLREDKTIEPHVCSRCDTPFPPCEPFYRERVVKREAVVDLGICVWCTNNARRAVARAKREGKNAAAAVQMELKQLSRALVYDRKYEQLKAERLELRKQMRKRKKRLPEKKCLCCKDSFPLHEKFYEQELNGFARICVFCTREYRVRIERAIADGCPKAEIELMRIERQELFFAANDPIRAEKRRKLKAEARKVKGPKVKCPECNVAYPTGMKKGKKYWRVGLRRNADGSSSTALRLHRCLSCERDHDVMRKRNRVAARKQAALQALDRMRFDELD